MNVSLNQRAFTAAFALGAVLLLVSSAHFLHSVPALLAGEITLHGLSVRHGMQAFTGVVLLLPGAALRFLGRLMS